MAVSVGYGHLMTRAAAVVDLIRLRAIQAAAPDLPLVLHGGSGIPATLRHHLASETSVCKFNIGTELRRVFGDALRAAIAREPGRFDRNQLLRETIDPMIAAARVAIQSVCGNWAEGKGV